MRVATLATGLTGLLVSTNLASAIQLDLKNTQSVLDASKTIVGNILSVYTRNGTGPRIAGILPPPYYWWEAGLMFDSLINYWSYSGDESIVSTIQQALVHQVGPDYNYMPPNQTKSLATDDQAVWANAAMTAAEFGLPMPSNTSFTWQQLAENTFNSIVLRWDTDTCGGGFRWQIFSFNNGYDYKNSQSQASFAQLAARLYRFTGNETYSDWAQKAVEWSQNVGLIEGNTGRVYDGADTNLNCSELNHLQWTSNYGWFLGAAAYERNVSDTRFWSGLAFPLVVNAMETFTKDDSNILRETACEPSNMCNVDQYAFKSVLARAFARTTALTMGANVTVNGTNAGTENERIKTIIDDSAKAAAAQCTGGPNGTSCGSNWYSTGGRNDGNFGIGQDLGALEVILATLPSKELRTSNATGGTGSTASSVSTSGSGNGTSTGSSTSSSATPNSAPAVSTSVLSSILGISAAGALFAFL